MAGRALGLSRQKKTPALGPRVASPSALPPAGPAQGGKAGGSKLPEVNLANNKIINKMNLQFYSVFT
jgi:hypothetical protein